MRYFVFLLDLDGASISHTTMQAYESLPIRRSLSFRWLKAGPGMVLTCGDDIEDAVPIWHYGEWTVVGDARLDNRAELSASTTVPGESVNDLELLLHYVAQHGPEGASRILGDFSFVVWNSATHSGLAGRDAMGVKRLYYTRHRGLLGFASRAEALAVSDRYNVRYLTEMIAGCERPPEATPYADVRELPSASVATLRDGLITPHRYWRAYDFLGRAPGVPDIRALAGECRELLSTSVRLRTTGGGGTWAQLSGGMDSSSIVSVAQWCAERDTSRNALAGAITYTDSHGTGADERRFSDAVVQRFGIRNELIMDRGMWEDDGHPPPVTDLPSPAYPLYARERQLCAIVRSNGGRVLLTGTGGDQLFAGNMFFFADWAASGRLREAVREMIWRAAIGRVSFWTLAYRNMVLPLLPRIIQRRFLRSRRYAQDWLAPTLIRRYQLRRRTLTGSAYSGRLRSKYGDAIASAITATPGALYLGVIDDELDVRHPFLFRPLIEFALGLPHELCVRPHAHKWLLREAMKGVLPDLIRSRIGKGSIAGPSAWALSHNRTLVEQLLDDPITAQMGIVDPARLRHAFEAAPSEGNRREELFAAIQNTLGIEAWLRTRSGRWSESTCSRFNPSSIQSALA